MSRDEGDVDATGKSRTRAGVPVSGSLRGVEDWRVRGELYRLCGQRACERSGQQPRQQREGQSRGCACRDAFEAGRLQDVVEFLDDREIARLCLHAATAALQPTVFFGAARI